MIPCRWLPLSTSKQRESPLSYALHFLRIISHQMCCAGERAKGPHRRLPPPSPPPPGGTAGAVGAVLRAVRGNRLCALIPNWGGKRRRRRKGAEKPDLHFSPAQTGWPGSAFAAQPKHLAQVQTLRGCMFFSRKYVVIGSLQPRSAHFSARAQPGNLGNASCLVRAEESFHLADQLGG